MVPVAGKIVAAVVVIAAVVACTVVGHNSGIPVAAAPIVPDLDPGSPPAVLSIYCPEQGFHELPSCWHNSDWPDYQPHSPSVYDPLVHSRSIL